MLLVIDWLNIENWCIL